MVVRNAQVEQRGRGLFYFDAPFVKNPGCLDVTFFQPLGSLLETLVGLSLCWVRGGGMRGCRRGETWDRW